MITHDHMMPSNELEMIDINPHSKMAVEVGDQRRRTSGGETRVPVMRLEHDTKQVKTHTSKHYVYIMHHNTNILLISNAIHTCRL